MSKRKVTGKLLVIQLGREETQIALMGAGSGIAFSSIVPTPAGAVEDGMIRNVDAVRGMLKDALNVPEYKKVRKAVFTLSTSQVISETITTPNLTGKKLEKVIQANIDEYFPVDTRDYQLVWQPIGPTGDNMLSVQLWAVPHAMLARYYGVANDCGLSLEAVSYCGSAIATAVGATFALPVKAAGKEKKKLSLNMELSFGKKKDVDVETAPTFENRGSQETDLYISLEKDLLGMTFVQEGQVVMQRFIQCGGDPSYQLAELAMMVDYFQASEHGRGTTIRGAVMGTLAQERELVLDLADMLSVPLSLVDLGCEPRWVMCLGAAAATLDFGVPNLNKPSKARNEVKSQLWQYILLLISGLAAVLMFMFLMNARLGWSSQIGILEATRQALTIQSAKTAGYADNYKNYSAQYDAYSSDWDAIFGSLKTYNDNLVLVLQELETIMPEKASVTGLQIAETGLAVQFACEDKEVAAYLIMELRDNMKYADLQTITSLQGGGSGPATEFGNPDLEGEAAPTEGGFQLTEAMKDQLVNMVAGSLDGTTIMDVALSMTPEQVELVEFVYGNQPQTTYSRLVAIKSDKGPEEVTMLRRANAVHELLTTNYFAMYHFFNLLGEDIYRDEPYMWKTIQADMMLPENQDIWTAIITGSVTDAETMRRYADRVVAMLVKDENTITATENLLCTSSKMERWYIYYLEQQLGMREKEAFPYMNVDQVIYDLMEGGFNTGDSLLDVKLNSLIPESAWDMLELIQKDDSDTSSLLAGLTESEAIKILEEYILKDGDVTETKKSYANKIIQAYIDKQTTGYAKIDSIIAAYLKDGTSGGTEKPKEEFIIGNYTEPQLKYLMDLYRKNGTTGNQEQDQLLYSILYVYNRDKTTGIPKLDKFLEEYFDGDDLASLLLALQGNNGTGSSGPVDTRIHFTAALAYNDNLRSAELNRKGLNYEEKIDKLTVEEGN